MKSGDRIKTIGQAIRKYRETAKFTQGDVAHWIGVDTSQVSRRESGEADYLTSELEIIAHRLGVTVLDFYKAVEQGEIDQRRAKWNGAYNLLSPDQVDAALKLVIPKSRKYKQSV